MTTQRESVPVRRISIPGQQDHHGSPFPLVYHNAAADVACDTAAQWVAEHRQELEQQAHEHGTVLFRGFPLHSAEDFDVFLSAFGFENFPYNESLSNAIRINYTPRVFSANEAPADVNIYLHHEMAQTPIFPGKLFFFCLQPATAGGQTPLCRSDVLFEQIQRELPQFAANCEALGLLYSNVMPSEDDLASGMGRSWQSTFAARDRDAAEQRLSALNYSWQWLDDGCLRATTPLLGAVREVSPGRKTFFNQLIAAFCGWKDRRNDPSKAVSWGDGSPIDRGDMQRVAELAEQLTFDVPWQAGDVALLDNFIVMHGRRTFSGPRKILASLADVQTHAAAV